MKRRRFIKSTLSAGLLSCPIGRAIAEDAPLRQTPRDFEGPYYPLGPRNRTNDLVIGEPRDKIHNFHGTVVNVYGEPLSGALVDIWHTDPFGRYKHPRDTTQGERWDDFLYWGETTTDEAGEFVFRTYVPGAYGRRPAHIHYKVWRNKQRLLTSQVYFAETGGARGASRSPNKADLQTVSLEADDDGVRSYIQIVI